MDKITTFTKKETRFLSNFYPHKKDGGKFPHEVKVFYNGVEFDCVENAYQAAKSLDKSEQIKISKLTPYQSVEYWQDRNDYRSDWHDIKLDIMKDLVTQKFTNNPKLKQMLLATGNMKLEEGNSWGDTFWGICDGIGENNLGKTLMSVRKELIQSEVLKQKGKIR